jgi:DNA-directed RNA polymerase specialized sigma24 family protein
VWNHRQQRWTLPLNAFGVQIVEAFCRKYPYQPACIKGSYGRLFRYALDKIGVEEVESVIAEAIAEAAARYVPLSNDLSAEKFTYIVHGCMMKLQRSLTRSVSKKAIATVQDTEGWLEESPARPITEKPQDVLADYGHLLNPRESRAMRFRYKLGLTSKATAYHLRVSKTRVDQIIEGAVNKLRQAMEGQHNQQTPEDGIHPPRSLRCKRSERTAASSQNSKVPPILNAHRIQKS